MIAVVPRASPDHQNTTPSRSILVAVDFPLAADQFDCVIELALAAGWPLHLLHAAAPDPVFVGFDEPGGSYDTHRRDDKLGSEFTELDAIAGELRVRGIEVVAHVITGPTVETIIDQAKDLNAAMIVMNDHRHRAAHRIVFGSVASALLKASPVPVLVVPPSSGDAVDAGFPAAVERLLGVIDRQEPTSQLSSLRVQAEAQLGSDAPRSQEEDRGQRNRLLDAVHHFETDHPGLTRALNDVSYYLSGTGL
jgi:nucleotide-binding universal stress UspA family protein